MPLFDLNLDYAKALVYELRPISWKLFIISGRFEIVCKFVVSFVVDFIETKFQQTTFTRPFYLINVVVDFSNIIIRLQNIRAHLLIINIRLYRSTTYGYGVNGKMVCISKVTFIMWENHVHVCFTDKSKWSPLMKSQQVSN